MTRGLGSQGSRVGWVLLTSAELRCCWSPVLRHLGCAGSWGCSRESSPQPPRHPGLEMVGFPLCSSLSKHFSESEVRGDSPAVSPSLSADLKPGSPCQRCRDHRLRQCRRTRVVRAGFILPFHRLGQSRERGCGSWAAGAPGSCATPICVLDVDCIPLKFLG